jgi:hypothetical protein
MPKTLQESNHYFIPLSGFPLKLKLIGSFFKLKPYYVGTNNPCTYIWRENNAMWFNPWRIEVFPPKTVSKWLGLRKRPLGKTFIVFMNFWLQDLYLNSFLHIRSKSQLLIPYDLQDFSSWCEFKKLFLPHLTC